MSEKLVIPYPVIVEGKYDKIKLSSIMEGQIISTQGFGVFKNRELAELLRKLSEKSMIIVLTDSDGGGKVIRSHISGLIPKDRQIQLYVPQIKGKERRKQAPGAQGLLGVEGMDVQLLRELLAPYASGDAQERYLENPLCKTDFYIDGLSGGQDSKQRRAQIALACGLPKDMTANALLDALRMLLTYEEYLSLVGRERKDTKC
ncbi:MAG: DUF4093 domain-containing protein [Ruminococcaceae bacterium]|nr:DUF4093 domain-containing protein [Oscillospiraceae bacterium]